MPKPKKRICKHNKFMETNTGSGLYRCMNTRCEKLIDMNDSIDLLDEGDYEQMVMIRRKMPW